MSILLRRRKGNLVINGGTIKVSSVSTSNTITVNILPKYVKFEGSGGAMRLYYGHEYYRDGGDWGVRFKNDNGKLRVDEPSGPMEHMNNCGLIEISYEEWREDNGHYAPSLGIVEEEFETPNEDEDDDGSIPF